MFCEIIVMSTTIWFRIRAKNLIFQPNDETETFCKKKQYRIEKDWHIYFFDPADYIRFG